jgi:hypothetical protein
MEFLKTLAFLMPLDDAVLVLDRHVLPAPRDEDGVTLWRGLALAVLAGDADEAARRARRLLRGPRPGRPAGERRAGRVASCSGGRLTLRIVCGEEALLAEEPVVLPLRRTVALSRGEGEGCLLVELAIDAGEWGRPHALARLLCALHHEYGGYSGFWADGEEALPNAALAVLCLLLEGYEGLARQAWSRHLEDTRRGPED